MAKGNESSRTTAREMEQLFGFVPGFFGESLPQHAHDQEWSVFRDFQIGDSALSGKVKHLIGLSVSAHIKCKYCIYFHTEAARAMGASDEELKEACFMGGLTVQMSNSISGMQVDYERFKADSDRAIAALAGKGKSEGAPAQH